MDVHARAALLAAVLGATVTIGNGAMAEDKTSEGTAGPEAPDDEPYWTPERLRAARPLPLPHPDAPPPETPPQTDDQPPSVSGAGSPGSGGVAPDDTNLLDSETEGSSEP